MLRRPLPVERLPFDQRLRTFYYVQQVAFRIAEELHFRAVRIYRISFQPSAGFDDTPARGIVIAGTGDDPFPDDP